MLKYLLSTAVVVTISTAAFAEPLKLELADPQPEAVTEGLAVSYATGAGGRSLEEAKSKLSGAKPGPALKGLSYLDTEEGETALTSGETQKVAAAITGYIKFDASGTYEVNFFSNDGLDAMIGGQQVALADEVRSCDPTGVTEIEVPAAGWYALEASYFQRKGSACLMMDWNVGGEMAPVPDTAFGYTN
ncbi:MAG: PA14 domain-containing protein [Sulfitobacter sp.]